MATLQQTSALVDARGNTLWQMAVGATLQQSAVAYLEPQETLEHAARFELACRVLIDGQVDAIAGKFYRVMMCYDNIASVGDAANEVDVTAVVANHYTDIAKRVAAVGV